MQAFTQAIHFLVTTVLDLFMTLLVLRFVFQWLRIDFYNPVAQTIVKLTNPALVPLRRLIPSVKSVDTACLVLIFVTCFIKLLISCLLQYHAFPFIGGLLVWSIADLFMLTLNIFFWAVIIQAIMSWVAPAPGHPIYAILYQLTAPLMQPARRLIKPISGIDVSPIVVLLGLQVLIILIGAPVRALGIAWSI